MLIIERERIIRDLLGRVVEERFGGRADAVGSASVGIEYAREYQFDAMIVDYQHNEMAPASMVVALRNANKAASILVLDTQHDPLVKAAALNAGADDYLEKPFALEELHARLISVVRRRHGFAEPLIVVGALTIDLIARRALVDGKVLVLQPRQYSILEFLAVRRGRVFHADEIFRRIWGDLSETDDKVVEVNISRLRNSLNRAGLDGRALIKTRWGMGWQFDAEALP